jgi:hypothetical protein
VVEIKGVTASRQSRLLLFGEIAKIIEEYSDVYSFLGHFTGLEGAH